MALTKAIALKIVNPAAGVVVAVQLVTAALFLFFSESIPFGLVRQGAQEGAGRSRKADHNSRLFGRA